MRLHATHGARDYLVLYAGGGVWQEGCPTTGGPDCVTVVNHMGDPTLRSSAIQVPRMSIFAGNSSVL